MQRREAMLPDALWSNQMPQLSSSQSGTPGRIQQTPSDQLDDAESLLLGSNFEDIENLLGDDMLGTFEDCLRDQELDSNLAPILEANLGNSAANGMLPTTSSFNGMPNVILQNPPVGLLAPKLSRTGTRPSFDETNSKIANFMAKIPFRFASCSKHEQRQAELDYSYNSEMDMNFHLRKFDYLQLFNKQAKFGVKVKALAALLKLELEEDHDYFLLRNADVVIQICVDHKEIFTNCLISWYGSHLRVNDRLKSLFQQNRWLSVMRQLKIMIGLIPNCVSMNDRINCLNGLLILEHDLTLLFKEALLATSIYGKSDVEVYRQRTDLTPFTIAIQWESLKPNCAVNEAPQFDLSQSDSLYVYLSVVYNEYSTLFPTTSCLGNNLEWSEMSAGINTPGKYCINFSRSMIIRKSIMSELLELDAAIYTVRPINWISELASDKITGQSLVFTRRDTKSECHRYIFSDSMLNESDVYLVRRITFNSPKTIVGILMLLRRQACFVGLVKNLFERFARRRQLPYTEHLVVKLESDSPTTLVLQFNNNRRSVGTVSIVTKNSGFEVGVCTSNGQKIEVEKLQEWSALLNRTWSIPTLLHKIIADLKQISKEVHPVKANKIDDTCLIATNGPKFNKFEYLQDKFIVKHLPKKHLQEIEAAAKRPSTEECDPKEQLKRQLKFLRSRAKSSPLLSEYFSQSRKIQQIKKSTALKQISLPPACLRTVMSTLSVNQPIRAITSNKRDLSRVPKFIVEAKTPSMLPSMSQLIWLEQRQKLLKRRRLRSNKMATNVQLKRVPKKPNILKTSTAKAATEKSVRLDSVVRTAELQNSKSVPDPNAQPARSILNQRRSQKVDSHGSSMNRFNLAQKIVRHRTKKRTRFFGILAGWRKFYKNMFRIKPEPKNKTTFKQEVNFGPDTLLSAQSENYTDPKLYPLPNPLSPDYFRRMNPQMPNFPVNTILNSNSFGLQNNYNINLNPTFPNPMNGNPMFNQPNLPMHLTHKRSIDGIKEMMDPSFDTSRMSGDGQHLMDLNASELAARRKERNINAGHTGLDSEMVDNEDDGFEDSDDESEECDPPPPHKIRQQEKLNERRKRDQELRDQRQEKINRMVLEKKKQAQKQEEEFTQRHQFSMRTTRNPSNAGLTPGGSFSLDQQANLALKNEERFEYEGEQKPTVESLSIKLPRDVAETIRRKSSQSQEHEKETRRSRKKLQRSSSVSSNGSNQSASSSDSSQKSQHKKLKSVKKEPGTERKSKKSNLAAKAAENSARSSSRTKAKEAGHKISRGKEDPMKRSSSASSSTSSSSSSSSGTSSSDSRPPPLTDRLQRQSSALTDILQQDDESRQSTRSTSSIPHLLANEPAQNWHTKEGRNSRKTSTISASTFSGSYPFELESGTKNEFDDPESPPFAQILASTSGKRQDDGKQKSNDAEKPRSKSKDKNRQKQKSGDAQSGTESDKQKDVEKVKKRSMDAMKSGKSVDKIADRLKEREKTTLKLKIGEKDEKPKEKQKEGDKLKVKDKSAVPKNKPSPRLQALPDVFDVPTTETKVFKRKRDGKEAIPPTKTRPKEVGKDGKPKDLRDTSKERSEHKSSTAKFPEASKDSKSKRPKEIKLLQEIPASPVPVQTRKRSPLPRRKDEPVKKTRLADPEFKPSTSVDKTLRSSKSVKTEEARNVVKRTLSTTSDDKRRKVRKVEKSDLKEPETPTKKKSSNLFPDLPEFTGRPCLSNLKYFKIPKVVDTETTKTVEKEKEVEVEKEKEAPVQEKEVQRSREPRESSSSTQKEPRPEANSRERWEREEKREGYPAERRDSYVESPFDRRPEGGTFFPNDAGQREHFYPNRGGSNHYSRGSKFYNAHHGNYPAPSHRNQPANYESSPVYNDRGSSFRRQRGGAVMKPGSSVQYDDYPANKARPPMHFTAPPHHKKSLTEIGESPSHQQPPRSASAQRRGYSREKPWSANYYPEEAGDGREFPSLMPPSGSGAYAAYNSSGQFQSPTEDQYDGRDRDFRPPYHRVETENSGGDSPDGLQIDENA